MHRCGLLKVASVTQVAQGSKGSNGSKGSKGFSNVPLAVPIISTGRVGKHDFASMYRF